MKKRMLPVLLMLVILISLVGCKSSSESTSASTTAANATLQKVLSSGTLRVGILLSNVPMGSVDANGKPFGYDVDVAQKLADTLGVKLELVDMPTTDRIPALETGKVDIVIGSLTRTTERAAKVAFSDPYFVSPPKCITLKGSTITENSTLSDLKGKTIGATKGVSTAQILDKAKAQYGFNVFLGDTQPDLVTALNNKQIDAFAIDGAVIDYLVLKNPDKYQVGPVISSPYYNCFGVNLNDTIWLQYVNTFIKEMNAKNFFKDLYKQYFGVENKYPLTPVY